MKSKICLLYDPVLLPLGKNPQQRCSHMGMKRYMQDYPKYQFSYYVDNRNNRDVHQ